MNPVRAEQTENARYLPNLDLDLCRSVKLPHQVHAVIFDMDGTIVNTERLQQRLWFKAVKHFNYEAQGAFFRDMIGLDESQGNLWLEQKFGQGFPVVEARRYRDKLVSTYIDRFGAPIKQGALEVLSYLQQNNIPTAVATTRHNAVDVQRRLGQLSSYFVTVVNGDDVENVKPAPDLFIEAARRLNVPAKNCLAVEDSPNGLQAAAAAGMMAILIPDLVPVNSETQSLSISVLPSLRAIIPLLERNGVERQAE